MVLQTERLILRRMEQSDFGALCRVLQDEKAMYAYEHAFDDREVQEWLDRQIGEYQQYGFGLWAAVHKESGEIHRSVRTDHARTVAKDRYWKSDICLSVFSESGLCFGSSESL